MILSVGNHAVSKKSPFRTELWEAVIHEARKSDTCLVFSSYSQRHPKMDPVEHDRARLGMLRRRWLWRYQAPPPNRDVQRRCASFMVAHRVGSKVFVAVDFFEYYCIIIN